MSKALRGEAVVHLPRASNNAAHGHLRLARRVRFFQLIYPLRLLLSVCSPISPAFTITLLIQIFFTYSLKKPHAMFGLTPITCIPLRSPSNAARIADFFACTAITVTLSSVCSDPKSALA